MPDEKVMALIIRQFPVAQEFPVAWEFPRLKPFPPVSRETGISREFPARGFPLNISSLVCYLKSSINSLFLR